MIASLKGQIQAKYNNQIVLDVNGVGYLVNMPVSAIVSLGATSDQAFVLCHMSVSESGVSLYGFLTQRDLDVFNTLISVNGVGPKMALSALSFYDADLLESYIASQDVSALAKITGIGKKIASRIVLELKDTYLSSQAAVSKSQNTQHTDTLDCVKEALSSMGFTSKEIDQALKNCDTTQDESALLQFALRRLA